MDALSTSPSSQGISTGRISPGGTGPSSPTRGLAWSALLGRRTRSNTATQQNGLPSPVSDNERNRTSYFRLGGRERSHSLGGVLPLDPSLPSATSTASTPLTEDMPAAAAATASFSVRLVPHLELGLRSLHFEPISRRITTSSNLKIGRFNERAVPRAEERPDARITFKSKVVSRTHAEIQVDSQGRFWVKDTKSSSGTFLNHIRLSGPGLESRLYPLQDGDVLQLGVDYQGGTEEMYRCVKIKVELNRGTPKSSNMFNAKAMKQLKALGAAGPSTSSSKGATGKKAVSKLASSESTDCCICLFAITVCQPLFIAPCSHVYHYKCIRPLLQMHHPGFSCPLCRTFADLEADVEQDDTEMADGEAEEEEASSSSNSPELPTKDISTTAEDETMHAAASHLSTSDVPRSSSQGNLRSRSAGASRRSSAASRRYPPTTAHAHDMAVPDAGDFQQEMRRSSIHVSGPHGAHTSPISITGRSSRPTSVRNFDLTNPTPFTHSHLASPPDTAVGAPSGAFTAADALSPDALLTLMPRPTTADVFGYSRPETAQDGQKQEGSSSMQVEDEAGSEGGSRPSSDSVSTEEQQEAPKQVKV